MVPRTTRLIDNSITLRPFEVDDAPAMVEAVQESIAESMPWMGWCTPDYDLDSARSWLVTLPVNWENGTQYGFAITNTENGKILGGTGLNHINQAQRLANLGYWVRTSATRQGVATRAARLVARFGIEKIGLLRAEIVVAVGNAASLRVAQKAGAQREGILRNRLIVRDKVLDAVMHSLTPGDFGIPIPGSCCYT
jgi:ribosomal-protein-serine acetyltransferase